MSEFTWSDCITCGVRYAMPTALYDHQRLKGGYHHCPNGHQQGWSKEESEIDRMRRERDQAKQQIARAEDEKRAEIAKRLKAEAATKKLQKRAASGSCPCCHRTFSNMNIHMRKQHPTFVAEQVTPLKLVK